VFPPLHYIDIVLQAITLYFSSQLSSNYNDG